MGFVGTVRRIWLGPPDGVQDDKMFGIADDSVGGRGRFGVVLTRKFRCLIHFYFPLLIVAGCGSKIS